MSEGEKVDIVDRLLAACNGHPYAKIRWPHRLLHDAAKVIKGLREKREQDLRLSTTTVGPFGDTEERERKIKTIEQLVEHAFYLGCVYGEKRVMGHEDYNEFRANSMIELWQELEAMKTAAEERAKAMGMLPF